MGARGPKSQAEKSVAQVSRIDAVRRPKPPATLSDEQGSVWLAVVEALPADWFGRETWGMLEQYCKHAVSARRVADLIDAEEKASELDLERYDRLLKMQEREGRAMSSLATRLRITKQATTHKDTKKGSRAEIPGHWNA